MASRGFQAMVDAVNAQLPESGKVEASVLVAALLSTEPGKSAALRLPELVKQGYINAELEKQTDGTYRAMFSRKAV